MCVSMCVSVGVSGRGAKSLRLEGGICRWTTDCQRPPVWMQKEGMMWVAEAAVARGLSGQEGDRSVGPAHGACRRCNRDNFSCASTGSEG